MHIHDVVRLYNYTHSCVHGKFINDVDIMALFTPCVDEDTLVIIHVNLVLVALSVRYCTQLFFDDTLSIILRHCNNNIWGIDIKLFL